MLIAAVLHYQFHWATGPGYNFVSGPLADITLVTSAVAVVWMYLRRHNCHVDRCWRLQWHPHPGHGHPVCRKHHPYGQGRGDHLHAAYHENHSAWLDKPTERQLATTTMTGVQTTTTGPGEVVTGPVTPWQWAAQAGATDAPSDHHLGIVDAPANVTDLDSKR